MANQPTQRLAWNDRWSQPTLLALLNPLKSHHRRTLQYVIDALGQMEGVQQSIQWYAAWKWTIQYSVVIPPVSRSAKPVEPESLAYLVPRPESPMVCVPLSDAVLRDLPVARLGKVVRDGIKVAKCAVNIHWATWTPTSQAEALQIIDLLKRRHKAVLQGHGELAGKA